MATTLALIYFTQFLLLVTAQICTPNPGVRREYIINFDDLNTTQTNQSVIPAPLTYSYLTFDPSWRVARNGSDIPFIPHSLSNALVSQSNYTTANAKISSFCSEQPFDMISLWMIGCWVNPRFFASDIACLVRFTGTKVNGTIVSFERPVRKTRMEIIENFPREGFTNLNRLKIQTRFEFTNATSALPAGRIGIDDMKIARLDGKVVC